eukprot:g7582.t1
MSPIRERLAYAARLKHGQSLHLMLGNPQEIVRDEQKVKDIVFGPSSPLANSQSPLARASRGAAGGSDPPVFPRQGDNLFQLGVAASNKKDHRTETGDEDDLAYLSGFDESAPAAAAPPPRPPASSRATEVAGDEGEEEDLAYLSGFDESGAGAAQAAQEELFCLHATVQEDPWLLLPPDQLPETESINSRRTRWSRAKQLLREDVLLELLRDAPNGGGVDDLRFGGARRDRSFCPRRLFLLAVLAGDVDVVRAIMPVAHEWIDELFDADDGILLHPYVNTYLASATPLMKGPAGKWANAAFMGHTYMVGLLLEYGADMEKRNCYGFTPLHLASLLGHVEVVFMLVEKVRAGYGGARSGPPKNFTLSHLPTYHLAPPYRARGGLEVSKRGVWPEDVAGTETGGGGDCR